MVLRIRELWMEAVIHAECLDAALIYAIQGKISDFYSYEGIRRGIVSEYSLGTAPHPGQFPVRNRIISGLSDVVIVVEARKKERLTYNG